MSERPFADFYAGAYGPTVRVATRTAEELLALVRVLEGLASGQVRELDACTPVDCNPDTIESFTLSVAPQPRAKSLTLTATDFRARIVWSATTEQWAESLSKARLLSRRQEPGHQYRRFTGRSG